MTDRSFLLATTLLIPTYIIIISDVSLGLKKKKNKNMGEGKLPR